MLLKGLKKTQHRPLVEASTLEWPVRATIKGMSSLTKQQTGFALACSGEGSICSHG